MMSSNRAHKNILLTGLPGCGKSTIIENIIGRLHRPSTGFFTREIQKKGHRAGFSINTLDGRQGTMAHVEIRSPYRVGRYGVDLQSIDLIAVPSMLTNDPRMVIVIDEIGKMECLSPRFKSTLLAVLDMKNTVLGSIALKGDAFIDAIKQRPDTALILVTPKNRDHLDDYILSLVIKD
ncbi:MAG: nucleoside-triphosphatase [Desulfobacteraceae bacterium]|jgi:nucleoside-triphosphatase